MLTMDIREATRENRSSGVPTRSDTNRPEQSQNRARSFGFKKKRNCTGFPRYREFGKGPGISKTVFPVMKSPGICNFHQFSVNRPGIWFALEMSGPERSVRFKAANK